MRIVRAPVSNLGGAERKCMGDYKQHGEQRRESRKTPLPPSGWQKGRKSSALPTPKLGGTAGSWAANRQAYKLCRSPPPESVPLDPSVNEPIVLKLHGDFSKPESI